MRMLNSEYRGGGFGADSEMKLNKIPKEDKEQADIRVRDNGRYERDERLGVSINEDTGQAEPINTDDPFEILARKQDALEAGQYDEDEEEKFVPTRASIREVSNAQKEIDEERAARRRMEKKVGWNPKNGAIEGSLEPVKSVPSTQRHVNKHDGEARGRKLKTRYGRKPKDKFANDWRKTA